ncbi:MAG: phytanoyl-CoA dioxygenase family protein [Chitinophagales bacterium]
MKAVKSYQHVFENKSIDDLFNEEGYVTMPLLNESDIETITRLLNDVNMPFTDSIFHSHIHSNYSVNIKVHEIVSKFFEPFLKKISLSNPYKIAAAVYIDKKPSQDSVFDIHSDDSLCDERYFVPINIWIPLVDVDYDSGTMCICKRSHKNTLIIRSNSIRDPFIENNKQSLLNDYSVIKLQKGNALIYSPSCVHFSPPNKSSSNRPVIAITLIPENSVLCIFEQKRKILGRNYFLKYNITREQLLKRIKPSELSPSEKIYL